MIIDALLDGADSVVLWLLGLLPVYNVTCGDVGGLAPYVRWVGGFVDMGAAGAMVGVILGLEFAVWAVQGVLWIYKKIPVVGGH